MTQVSYPKKFIKEKVEEFEANSKDKEREAFELKSTINDLNVRLDKADRALDRQKQYSIRISLLIHGIHKENQENINEVGINILKRKWTRKYTSRY